VCFNLYHENCWKRSGRNTAWVNRIRINKLLEVTKLTVIENQAIEHVIKFRESGIMKGIQKIRAICMWNPGNLSDCSPVDITQHTVLFLDVSWSSCYFPWSSLSHSLNMLALLWVYTIVEQWAVIWFLCLEGVKPFWDSQRCIRTIWRKLYYAKEVVPVGGRVPKWKNKYCCWRLLGPCDHIMNGG
jgi:hypothetical protein